MKRKGCVTYNEHTDHRYHTDHDSEAVVVPASAVSELEYRLVYVTMWSHDPEWYDDAEHTQNMKHEDNRFCQWQTLGQEYIEERTANDNAHCKQGLMPCLYFVTRRAKCSEAEDKGCL